MILYKQIFKTISKAAAITFLYALWCQLFRLVVATILTYAYKNSSNPLQEISDILTASELNLYGIASVIYILIIIYFYPYSPVTKSELLNSEKFERRFLPGALQGSILSSALVSAFLLSGYYHYLGWMIRVDDAPFTFFSIFFRVACILFLVFCEEYLFRQKILLLLRKHLPEYLAAIIVTLLYTLLKSIQFQLGVTQLFSIVLISFYLSLKAMRTGEFYWGAGFWAAILIVLHPLLSLPIFGYDFQGVILVKYDFSEADGFAGRILTGGVGGPLSSAAMILLFSLSFLQVLGKTKKNGFLKRRQGLN